jgi:ribosomal-protein-alanine N-acetyltransferase
VTPVPTLTTERLTMRLPQAADVDAYAVFYSIPSDLAGKYRGPRTRDEARLLLEEDIDHWQRKGFGMWLLVRREDGAIVGGCGIAHPDDWPSHELTWWLMPEERGKGYATEASRAAIAFGYDTLGWPSVETHMRDQNLPARRLAERLGGEVIRRDTFPDGVARDVFALPHPGPQPSAGNAMEASA